MSDLNAEAVLLIDRTEEILNARGWFQGASIGRNGEVCMGFALALALAPVGSDAYNLVLNELHQVIKDREGKAIGFAPWNDKVAKAYSDVVEVLHETKRRLQCVTE